MYRNLSYPMNSLILFGILVCSNFLLSFGINSLILTDDVYYYYLIDTLSEERTQEFLKTHKEFEWIMYAFGPFVYGIKIFLVAACFYTGFFFRNIEVKFSTLFGIALKSEFLFLLIPVARLIWFSLFERNYSLDNVIDFPPYTVVSLFTGEVSEFWIKYPLSFLNILQLAYIFTTAEGISQEFDMKYSQSASLVLQTYGSGLLLWILFTLFMLVGVA